MFNRSNVLSAVALGPACLQNLPAIPGLTFAPCDEDCLFLNVYAPVNASNLLVLVWIHGGGYGAGFGAQDLSAIINVNNNSFIGVEMQYRVS